jgi:hypothetical protein
MSLMLVLVVFVAGVPSAEAQESRLSEKQKSQLIKRFPKSDANKDGKLDDAELLAFRDFFQARRNNAHLAPASNGKPQGFGLEAAHVILGHAAADVTQIYAERDLDKAIEVAKQVG